MDDSEIVLISDSRVSSVPIIESGEPWIDLTTHYPELKCDQSRQSVQKVSSDIFLARREVAERLMLAQSFLPRGMFLQIKECYRPLWVQKKFWLDYTSYLKNKNPQITDEELEKEASKYIAPIHVAPHATGGAVDLILIDEDGQPLDMGTEFNASPDKTRNRTYTNSNEISEEARKNREVLSRAMSQAGFVNYPTEWWHWSYGDKYWAFQKGERQSLYGHRKLEFHVRKANSKDIEAIAFINSESWKTTYRGVIDPTFLDSLSAEKQLPRAKRLVESSDLDCLVVCETETSKLAGFACFGKNREKNVDADMELQAIYLLEEFQGFGAGKALFEEGVRLLQKKSSQRMMVSVFEANKLARSFYEKQDGKLIGADHVDIEGVRYPTATYLWELK